MFNKVRLKEAVAEYKKCFVQNGGRMKNINGKW